MSLFFRGGNAAPTCRKMCAMVEGCARTYAAQAEVSLHGDPLQGGKAVACPDNGRLPQVRRDKPQLR